jgi:hypothetical protein
MNKQHALDMINRQVTSAVRLSQSFEYKDDIAAQSAFYNISINVADGMRQAFTAAGVFTFDEDGLIYSQLFPSMSTFKCTSVSLD